jgi:hypothetical protein
MIYTILDIIVLGVVIVIGICVLLTTGNTLHILLLILFLLYQAEAISQRILARKQLMKDKERLQIDYPSTTKG